MLEKHIKRLKLIDHLVQIKGTGSPKTLANRLGMSERSLYILLNAMKENGAPIAYDRSRKSYFYEQTGRFQIMFFLSGGE